MSSGRGKVWLLLAGALLLVGLITVTVGGRDSGVPLDPDGYGRDGARATREVLADHGVEVTVARGADEFAAARAGTGTTVLVTSTDQLGESTLRRLREDAHGAELVLVQPGPELSELLDVPRGLPVSLVSPVRAECDGPLRADLRIEVDQALAYQTPQGCFAGEHGYLVATPEPRVTVLGAGEILTNDQALRADNAAVSLWLLGRHDRVVWYVPDAADLTGSDTATLRSLLPAWLGPALLLSGLSVLALMLWRGRRLGPLVREPLPVSVRALETTRSRGRMYRKAGDRGHAARALRAAAAEDVARRLHLPPQSIQQTERFAREVAAATGLDPADVATLLAPDSPPPANDRELIHLAGRLAELDREVRRS